ncbi:MAG TPA: BTAD domain-containing putative transcriptional regulator [Actinomycetota bacterium]|nr:BTAD domain-containing putative transcriptional regulator [Actinomycetota bacterium]
MAELRIALLGPPRVERDGAPIEVDTRKAIALLAFLAVQPERHGRDAVAGLLWPDYDTEHARGALRRTLSTLNKAVGPGWLAADRTTVGLARTTFWLDVAQFEELVAAVRGHGHAPEDACPACVAPLTEAARLHRGDFLAGFSLRDSSSFDDWQYLQAERLRRELATTLERLATAQIGQHRWDDAVDAARRFLALDPLHEPAHRQLMRIYAWSGRRGAALRQFQACQRILEEELGVEPLEETVAVHEAIQTNRLPPPPAVASAPPAAPAPPTAASGAPAPRPPVGERSPTGGSGRGVVHSPPAPLVGRAAEWAALLDAYAAVTTDGWLVVIEGEAGIGKTRLAAELAGHARSLGASVLGGRCYEEDAAVAYGPFIEGLRGALASPRGERAGRGAAGDSPGPGPFDGVPRHWLAEARRLLPELAEAHPDLPEPGPLDGPAAGRQFLEGISQLLLAACAGPVPGLLVLDDLHCADEASLEVLAYLIHRLEGRPLLVVACWRSEQVPADARLRRLAAEARRTGHGSALELRRLDAAEVAELITAVAPARAGAAGLLHERTEGLPFLVLEYLAAIGDDGELPALPPGGARDLLAARVRGVGDAARQVLATAAVLGRSFDVDTARAASGRSDEEAVAALEELTARGLVHEVAGDVYDFGHGLVRDLVYSQTSLARRRLLHRRVGEALAAGARGRRPQEPPAASIARHLELGGAAAEAASYHRLAGDQARAVFANHEALVHYRAAVGLGHPDTSGLHAAVGDLETLLGNYDAALAAYTVAADAAPATERWGIEQKLGAVCARRGDWAGAERHLAAAQAGLGTSGAQARRARLAADRSLAAHRQGRDDTAERLAGDALELAADAGDADALARAHGMLGMLGAARGDHDGARRHLEQSLALAEALPDPSARVAALNNLALAYRATGQLDQAIAHTRTALALCARQGDRHREAALHNNLADLLHLDGQHGEAMDHLKRAVAIFAEVGEPGTLDPEIWKLVSWG